MEKLNKPDTPLLVFQAALAWQPSHIKYILFCRIQLLSGSELATYYYHHFPRWFFEDKTLHAVNIDKMFIF